MEKTKKTADPIKTDDSNKSSSNGTRNESETTLEVGTKSSEGSNGEKKALTKVFSGTVVSNKMKGTIVVAVTRYVKHTKYKKFVKRVKRYKVHDAGNTKEVGDSVRIEETRPISKDKTYKIV